MPHAVEQTAAQYAVSILGHLIPHNGMVRCTCNTLPNRNFLIRSYEKPAQKRNTLKFRDFRVFFGDPLEIRTPDPLLKRQLLCLLS